MMRYSSAQVAPESIVTAVDCQNQVRSWRLLRSLFEFLIPSCNCTFVEEEDEDFNQKNQHKSYYYSDQISSSKRHHRRPISTCPSTVTGTMFGYRGGKMCFCIQTSLTSSPILLVELLVPTKTLAKEMQGGILHIELKNETLVRRNGLVWTMYGNGRKVGLAVNREPSFEDLEMIRLIGSVQIGAGSMKTRSSELIYLRARFERVCGPLDVESFHLIDPDGCTGQELSISFHGSRV